MDYTAAYYQIYNITILITIFGTFYSYKNIKNIYKDLEIISTNIYIYIYIYIYILIHKDNYNMNIIHTHE